jgi:hypothetical protein
MVFGGLLATRAPRRLAAIGVPLTLLAGLLSLAASGPASAADPCAPPVVNPVACENTLPGDPPSDWQETGAGDQTIQGFATSMSVNVGETVSFKINTPAKSYHIDILRIGYYQGNGARKIVSGIRPAATLPQAQPACLNDTSPTGLVDCGNWAVSASWAVPGTAVSGLYVAHIVRDDTGGGSLIPFVVRNDASHSALLFQTSDETWEAYNTYGGNSLYSCTVNCPPGNPQAYKGADKVSYNRPFHTALDDQGRSWFMYTEYPMIRFLEANGYDVSYMSGIDVSTRGSLLLNHKVFLSVGHDEYWSGQQRANVQAACDAGVNLAFFSGNEVFWKTRLEPGIDGSNTANRTLVTYKETHFDAPTDPQDPPTWTGAWADPRFSPPADGGRPQNALTGQLFDVNTGTTDIQVPSQYSKLRIWRNTTVASLAPGQTATLGAGLGTLGYEWDVDADNGFRPAGLMDMSSTTDTTADAFIDYGSNTATRSVTHHLTLYRAPGGALVFGAGTVQWAWGLDNATTLGKTDPAMQQATVNLLADMGAQPATLIAGLTPAAATTDTTAPASTITSPSAGATLQDGSAVTITGTAADAGGGVVAGVEVSADGGTTWHPVTTMSAASTSVTWSYTWVAHGNPSTVIESRAVDDSGNLEQPASGTTVSVNCPCSIWGTGSTPGNLDSGDPAAINVGVQFTTDAFGTATGVRFYKASTNTGTHVGSLWTASGQLLASATFTGETASGWQQVNFAQPVLLSPHTTYVASYLAPKGHYSEDGQYFYSNPAPGQGPSHVDSPPLHALVNTGGATNGVFTYASTSAFPSSTFNAENYWVDVVFSPAGPPGQAASVIATAGYASAGLSWSAPASGGPVTSYIITPYIGSTAQTPATVTGSPAPTSTTVTGLTNGVTYTFTVTAANPNGQGTASAPSNAVAPSASASLVQNGGFESGLANWAAGGVAPPSASGAKTHSGTGAALLGTLSGSEPGGDSTLTQTITVPASGTTTLSFWYLPTTADALCSGASCQYDWQEAQIRSTGGQTLASVFKSNSNSGAWTQVSFNVTPWAGQTAVLWFNVHQDGSNPPDDTSMYLDDVSVTGSQPTAPAAPTGVTAAAGNGTASVTWTAPPNGGSPITSYTVTPFIGASPQTPVTVAGSPPATSASVTGLTNGTAYTFTVTATNANGTGPASAPSSAVTPTGPTAPGAPAGVSAAAGNGTATVTWTAPADGGSPITSYTVTPFIGASAQTPVTVTGTPPATSATVTGLTNGTAYTFTVTATNAIGTGPASAPSSAVTPAAPSAPAAPTGVTAAAGNASATVTWTVPANGGSPITSYTISPFIGASPQTPVTVTGSPPATSATVSGLTNGTAYTFTVTATSAVGTGPASAASNAVAPAAAGPITVDKTVFTDGSGTMTSPSLTTTAANELVVALVSGDGPVGAGKQAFTVTGAGLTWTLARRSNAHSGDAEIWWARSSGILTAQTVVATPTSGGFHGSLTVVAFAKAAGIGVTGASSAASGAQDLVLSGTGAGSWVYAVGNDWDNPIARTVAAGQVIVHQRVDASAGDTYWVQSTTAANAGPATVDIHDGAPTTDQWNYAGIEVLPG